MPRLFSGIEIPPVIADRLAGLRGGIEGARWVEPENYHITLRFIGDVDGTTAARFEEALAKIRFRAFSLALDGLGTFGGKKPHAVWAGVARCERLDALARANDIAAQRAGIEPESRNFHPHVTLARLRNGKPQNVAKYLSERGGFLTQVFPVTRFVLFSSRASKGGGPYVVEQTYPLEPAPAGLDEPLDQRL